MPKPHIDYEAAKRFVLVMMFDAFHKDERMDFSVRRVRQKLNVPNNLIQVTFESLEDDGLIEEVRKQQSRTVGLLNDKTVQEWIGTDTYELTGDGRVKASKIPDEIYDLSLLALADGSAAATAFSSTALPDLPLAPYEWQPLPIDQSEPTLTVVREALDDLLTRVEQDNGYKATAPDERASVLAALQGARTILSEASNVTYSAFVTYIVWPTERLLARFTPDTLIGLAGKTLWDAIADWAKGHVGSALDHIFKLGK